MYLGPAWALVDYDIAPWIGAITDDLQALQTDRENDMGLRLVRVEAGP
jgi:hypothetical protein